MPPACPCVTARDLVIWILSLAGQRSDSPHITLVVFAKVRNPSQCIDHSFWGKYICSTELKIKKTSLFTAIRSKISKVSTPVQLFFNLVILHCLVMSCFIIAHGNNNLVAVPGQPSHRLFWWRITALIFQSLMGSWWHSLWPSTAMDEILDPVGFKASLFFYACLTTSCSWAFEQSSVFPPSLC